MEGMIKLCCISQCYMCFICAFIRNGPFVAKFENFIDDEQVCRRFSNCAEPGMLQALVKKHWMH